MSLYGAMMIGVSALDAFSNALSTSSSNIANVNTIGYKDGQTNFSTLVASAMGAGAMSSIGVVTSQSQNVSQQGLITTASSPTDMAISGNGFFVVGDGTGDGAQYYTRAGDFTPDQNGNLRNSAGFYLMGYPLDSNGQVGTGTMLSDINLNDLTGKAEPTTTMTIQANLQASTEVYGGTYTPGDMASGNVTPDFTRTIDVYDSQGGSQPVTISYLKTGANTWKYEVSYAGDATNLSSTNTPPQLLFAGEMSFDSNGNLVNADDSQTTPVGSINVTIPFDGTSGNSGLNPQTIAINFGTPGEANGMSQFDSASTLTNSTVDGALFGTLTGVSVGSDGILTATFSNGLTQPLYQLPLATFANPDGLNAVSGNAWQVSAASGNAVINSAGSNGTGTIQGGALEGSTVDLATEFTNLITTQRAYTASTRVITTASQMLDELNQIGR